MSLFLRWITAMLLMSIIIISIFFNYNTHDAKTVFLQYLKNHYQNRYELVVFKRNFSVENFNPNIFLVELCLRENKEIHITFAWDAKKKALYKPFTNAFVATISDLTKRKQAHFVLKKQLQQALCTVAQEVLIDTYNGAITIVLTKDPDWLALQRFDTIIKKTVAQYPLMHNELLTRVTFKTPLDRFGFYQLIIAPDTALTSKTKITALTKGSIKAQHLKRTITKALQIDTAYQIDIRGIWVHQHRIEDLYLSLVYRKQDVSTQKRYYTPPLGVYLIKTKAPLFSIEMQKHYSLQDANAPKVLACLEQSIPLGYGIDPKKS